MSMKGHLLIFLFLLCNTVFSQELYIMSHPAANLSRHRIEFRNNVMSYDNFKYFHNSFEINMAFSGILLFTTVYSILLKTIINLLVIMKELYDTGFMILIRRTIT